MTVDTIASRARKRGLLASAIAWVWPQPLQTEDRGAGLWASRAGDVGYGRRGLMATLFGWMWPAGLDRSLRPAWRASWLWSWIWPGRVMGPDGEICPLAPWRPAVSRAAERRGAILAMLAALAIAAPTFMEGDAILDGGRLNVLRSGGATEGGGAPPVGDQAADLGSDGGAGGGGTAGGAGPTDGPPGDFAQAAENTANSPDDLVGGDGSGPPEFGGEPGEPGLTTFGPPTGGGDDLSPEAGLLPVGGGGAGGGGGGGGGGQPTDPTDGDDPFTPPGANPPVGDPSGPLNPPNPPNVPGDKPPGSINPPTHFDPDPPTEGPRGPGEDDPIDNTGPIDGVAAVPEPTAWAMMILGFGAVGYTMRRRRFAASVG